VVAAEDSDHVLGALSAAGETSARIIGEIARSTTSPRVRYER